MDDFQPLMDALAENAALAAGASRATLWLVEDDALVARGHHGPAAPSPVGRIALNRESAIARAVFDLENTHLAGGLASGETGRDAAGASHAAGPAVVAPLQDDQRPLGALAVEREGDRPFAHDEIARLETAARLAAMIVARERGRGSHVPAVEPHLETAAPTGDSHPRAARATLVARIVISLLLALAIVGCVDQEQMEETQGASGLVAVVLAGLLVPINVSRVRTRIPLLNSPNRGLKAVGWIGYPLAAIWVLLGAHAGAANSVFFGLFALGMLAVLVLNDQRRQLEVQALSLETDRLRAEVQELHIEIDRVKAARDVAEITESEYFERVQARARQMREARRS